MPGPYRIIRDGEALKMPSKDGQPIYMTRAEFEACCCPEPEPPAPCECPCETWPPETWPCGGLVEDIAFELHPTGYAAYRGPTCSGDFIEGIGNRVLPCTLSAGETPCTWEGVGMWQAHVDDPNGTPFWGDAFEVSITVRLVGAPVCRWEIQVFDDNDSLIWSGHKPTGLTPAGQYIDDADPDGLYPECNILNPGDPPEDQDSQLNYGTGATVS